MFDTRQHSPCPEGKRPPSPQKRCFILREIHTQSLVNCSDRFSNWKSTREECHRLQLIEPCLFSVVVLHENIDQKLLNKSHGPTRYKIGVIHKTQFQKCKERLKTQYRFLEIRSQIDN